MKWRMENCTVRSWKDRPDNCRRFVTIDAVCRDPSRGRACRLDFLSGFFALTPFVLPPQLLRQRQECDGVSLRNLQKLQEERDVLQERLAGLQRAVAQLEGERREMERSSLRLEKDKNALKKTLDKVRGRRRYPNINTAGGG